MRIPLFYPLSGDSSDSSVTVHAHNCHLENPNKINGFRTLVTEVTAFSISLSSQKKVNTQYSIGTVGIKISVVEE